MAALNYCLLVGTGHPQLGAGILGRVNLRRQEKYWLDDIHFLRKLAPVANVCQFLELLKLLQLKHSLNEIFALINSAVTNVNILNIAAVN
jgi:hypothetical protein